MTKNFEFEFFEERMNITSFLPQLIIFIIKRLMEKRASFIHRSNLKIRRERERER